MTETLNQVKIHNELTESFETTEGLKYGDGLASLLFNLALEHVIGKPNLTQIIQLLISHHK